MPPSALAWDLRFDNDPRGMKRSAIVNRKGKVEWLYMSSWVPGNYQPATPHEQLLVDEIACVESGHPTQTIDDIHNRGGLGTCVGFLKGHGRSGLTPKC